MTDKNVAEIQTISELALILTISVFSVVLIVLDILLSWEKWMIPLVLAAMLGCVATYVLGLFSFKAACYIYGIILIVEVFYYTVKAKTVYDCTAVIILMLVILAMTQYQALTWLGFASSYIGVLYGLGSRSSGGLLRLGLSHIVSLLFPMDEITSPPYRAHRLAYRPAVRRGVRRGAAYGIDQPD